MPMCDPALRTTATPDAVEEIDRWIDALWADNPAVPPVVRAHVSIAVTEIAANIVKHATRGLHRPVELKMWARVRDDDVIVVLADDGVEAPDDLPSREMPHELDESGRGIPLARAALSVLEYRRAHGGNLWTLVSKRF
jgi:serine/threonine-protein kinase RsbW